MRIIANVEFDKVSAAAGAHHGGEPSIRAFSDYIESPSVGYLRKILDEDILVGLGKEADKPVPSFSDSFHIASLSECWHIKKRFHVPPSNPPS
ncbi:MAG: hypothetical protein A2Y36_00290 [Treponema sp. GWA1_62_8]|nr:MAG: hypothetical protein A2Y36_00290 [Treponema sp. GWA1_62_8]